MVFRNTLWLANCTVVTRDLPILSQSFYYYNYTLFLCYDRFGVLLFSDLPRYLVTSGDGSSRKRYIEALTLLGEKIFPEVSRR